jgi:hypothetical protein
MKEIMTNRYLERILSARRLSIETWPATNLISTEPSSTSRLSKQTFEYCVAETRDKEGNWKEEILCRYYDYEAARGVVGVIAASLVSPLAATYVLGLKKGGEAWLLSNYPNLSFGNYGLSISTLNGTSFAECLGITSLQIESDGAFDLLTLSQTHQSMQFLCCHNHPKAMWLVEGNGRLSFQKDGLDRVIQTMTRWSESLRSKNDFGCFQDREIWELFLGVVQNARAACNVTGSLNVSIRGSRELETTCSLPYRELPDQYPVFEKILGLAYIRYAPCRLLRRPQHWHPSLALWFRDPRYTPCLELEQREFSPRERLSSLSELEAWLQLGGATVSEIAAWPRREQAGLSQDFVSRHKKKSRKAVVA